MPGRPVLHAAAFDPVGDGLADDTPALRQALDAAAGKTLVVGPGVYRVGTLFLPPDTDLVLERDATLLGDPDPHRYTSADRFKTAFRVLSPRWHHAMLVVDGVENVTIRGEGVLDGGDVRDPRGEEGLRGPHLLHLSHARRVRVAGVSFTRAGNYAVLGFDTGDVRLDDVRVTGGWDALHLRHCHDVHVAGCTFVVGDDAFAGGYLHGVRIRRTTLDSACNAVRLIGPTTDLLVEDCTTTGPCDSPHVTQNRTNTLGVVLVQPGSWYPTPGPTDNLTFRRLRVRNVQGLFHLVARPGCPVGRVTFEDVTADDVYGPASSAEAWGDDLSPAADRVGHLRLTRVDVRHVPARPPLGPDTHKHARDHHDQTLPRGTQVPPPRVGLRALPARCLYLRGVDRVSFGSCRFSVPGGSGTPPVVTDDVGTADGAPEIVNA